MEKMVRYARIPEIKGGIALSDPSYDESVWCQYRAGFQSKDWLMKLETSRDSSNDITMILSVGRRTLMAGLTCEEVDSKQGEFHLSYPSRFGTSEVELGIDTARIFLGSLDNFNHFAEEGAIYTGADGQFGNLLLFFCKGEDDPAGFLLLSSIDGELAQDEQLFQTLCASFDGKEIDKIIYESLVTPTLSLRAMTAVEVEHAKAAEKAAFHTTQENEPDR